MLPELQKHLENRPNPQFRYDQQKYAEAMTSMVVHVIEPERTIYLAVNELDEYFFLIEVTCSGRRSINCGHLRDFKVRLHPTMRDFIVRSAEPARMRLHLQRYLGD